jgi:hypothetical protein
MNPTNHNTSRITNIVHNMISLSFAKPRHSGPAPDEPGSLPAVLYFFGLDHPLSQATPPQNVRSAREQKIAFNYFQPPRIQ